MFNRLNRVVRQALDPDKALGQARQPTLEDLLPGDVIGFWDGGDSIVQAVLECSEELNGRETVWRWHLLDEDRVLEVAPDGNTLYERSVVLHQNSAEFETLTTRPENGGVLSTFEARVREGIAARNPALFDYAGRVYQVVSTSTFAAEAIGQTSYPNREVWRDINPTVATENVYFVLEPAEETPDDTTDSEVLGIWTSHIALFFGRPLKPSDIQAIYPRAEPEVHGR